MVFSSTMFLFVFLPVTLIVYFVLPSLRWRNVWLIIASLFFYAWGEAGALIILVGSIVCNWLFGLGIARLGKRTPAAKVLLAVAIVANLTTLGAFKYLTFLLTNLNIGLGAAGIPTLPVMHLDLPIGISFYTFQALSYLIDVSRGSCEVETRLSRLMLVICLFPHQIAGPIIRYSDVADQVGQRTTTRDDLVAGFSRFVGGLAKKVLIANTLSVPVEQVFSLPSHELTASLAWLAAVGYTLQIYFDFSGYSDMAIGIARIFGFHLKENFLHPYQARSVTEFWRRWHISLSSWFRDYLYIPLGGNRGSPFRTYFNLALVFLLCGLWHGASYSFLIWGMLHGLLLVVERVGLGKGLAKLPVLLQHAYTMLVVTCVWMYFRAETPVHAEWIIKSMFGGGRGDGLAQNARLYMDLGVVLSLIGGVIFATPLVPAFMVRLTERLSESLGLTLVNRELAGTAMRATVQLALMLLCLMAISSNTHNPFIYYRF
ncbi:MAG: MBOAT family protein [Chitinophagaceae bacterium]|nr:MBOAT family protein [Oligoflexus sp.]